MPIKDLILQTRSYRRFHQTAPIPRETLLSLIDLARHSASGSNLQPLKYIISCDPDKNAIIFPHLAWAGYLKDWDIRYWRDGDGVHHVPKRPMGEIIISQI